MIKHSGEAYGLKQSKSHRLLNMAMWCLLIFSLRAIGPTASFMLRKPEVMDHMFSTSPPYDASAADLREWQANRQWRIDFMIHTADVFAAAYLISIILAIILLSRRLTQKQGTVGLIAIAFVPIAGWIYVISGGYR